MNQARRSTRGRRPALRAAAVAGVAVLAGSALAACGSSSRTAQGNAPKGHALLVGTFHGHAGKYQSIQAAVDAAQPGDWILVAPGDYHERADLTGSPTNVHSGGFGGVLITKSGIHLRGMDRSTVVVDGTKAGGSSCSAAPTAQQLGAKGSDGKPMGRNGIVSTRRTTSGSTTSRSATSSPAADRRATRSGGTAAASPGRSACTPTRAAT